MPWLIVPVVAIIAPFVYFAYSQWVDLKKAQVGSSYTEDHTARLIETEDALAAAQRRIENLETIVVNRLLEAPSSEDGVVQADASELIAQNTPS